MSRDPSLSRDRVVPIHRQSPHTAPLLAGVPLTITGWTVLWTVETFWNPLAFAAMWTGAAVVMWGLSSRGYPGVRRHAVLLIISVPLWWWFELVNERVANWQYILGVDYSATQYAVLASVAFSTVVPALMAATALVSTIARSPESNGAGLSRRACWGAIGLGVLLQAGVFAFPVQMYPFVWVAPFLVVDGMVGLSGGPSLLADMARGRWRLPLVIGAAGLLCGFLWEFWNYWAAPKWVYHVPLLGFARVFEMPLLGYGGYVPFAWSVVQLVRLLDRLAGGRLRLSAAAGLPDALQGG